MSHQDSRTRTYLDAAANLLESCLANVRELDPDAVAGLTLAMTAGAMLSLRSTFAPSTGLAHLAVEVIEPSGQTHTLMSCELQRQLPVH